jgi:hypothetical protein
MHGLNGSGRGRWPRAIVHQQWLAGLEKKKKKTGREHGGRGKRGANLNNDFKIEVSNFLVQLITVQFPHIYNV